MMPTTFPGWNIDLQKPDDWTDEECSSCPAYYGNDEKYPYYITAWKPSKEDLEALNAGRPLYMKITSARFPPTALYTTDENLIVN